MPTMTNTFRITAMDNFAAARLKVERAVNHITELKRVIDELPECYSVEVEVNPESKKPSIKRAIRGLGTRREQIALLTGDAVHNLRTALDYAWIGVVKKLLPSALDDFSKFPVRKTREEVENALKGRKVDTLCPALYERVVSDIRPYFGGEDSIVACTTWIF